VLGAGFLERYYSFMNACFVRYSQFGDRRMLRASVSQQRAERGADWNPAWEQLFAPEEMASTYVAVAIAYNNLINSFSELELPREE
jgi:hypothetical protein